jgi:lipocalin-like protein
MSSIKVMERTMKERLAELAIAAVIGFGFAMSSIAAFGQKDADLVGTWEWISVDNTLSDGTRSQPFGAKPGGYLEFGADGRFVWLITRPGRAKFASGRRDQGTADENKATVQGSLAYCGTYAVDKHTLVMRVEASTYPNEEGAEQRRTFAVSGDELTWKNPTVSTGASGVARLRRMH